MTASGANRLYIVDDEPAFRKFVRIVAERAGWPVTECSDGAELLRALESETEPVVILLDIVMPEMDGIETVQKLSEMDLPMQVYFMTGGSQAVRLAAKYISEDSNFNVGGALGKPITVNELLRVLDDAVAA